MHIAAVLYAIGARLDQSPELLIPVCDPWTIRNSLHKQVWKCPSREGARTEQDAEGR
jgi:hypothetical protein